VELSKDAITGRRFGTVAHGYDPAEVDAHLAEVADAVLDLAGRMVTMGEDLARGSNLAGLAGPRATSSDRRPSTATGSVDALRRVPEPARGASVASAEADVEHETIERRPRLLALKLAMDGAPREEAERQLRQAFPLEDCRAVVDDAYERARGL
jgi:DivIVA domain-containing protein